MQPHSKQKHHVVQSLRWDAFEQERLSPGDTMFTATGRRIYVIGDIDGRFRPRSNPYDLHAYGRSDPNDPLAEKLQGVWAQPVKGFRGYAYAIEVDGETWLLEDAERFIQTYAFVQFEYARGALRAARRDFAALDLPLLVSTLTLRNDGDLPLDLRVTFQAGFDLEDAWFTKLGERRNAGETLAIENEHIVARAEVAPDVWAAAAGGLRPGPAARLLDNETGELAYKLRLEPGGEEELTFGMAIASQGGAPAALAVLERGLDQSGALLAARLARFSQAAAESPRLTSPDPLLNTGFSIAQANLRLLEAEQPSMGRYFYAGLEIFPFWFSNDGAYSAVGLLAAGLGEAAKNHLRIGLMHLGDGQVPHQISPSGKVAFAGNAQETPLWVLSIWDIFRWSGDRDFLTELFPGAWKGMFNHVLGTLDPDGDGYPSGPGMVEVEGMGAEKLDSAVYTWAALHALAEMADTLGRADEALQARARAERIAARFDADWWDEENGTYAMSLTEPGNARYPVPHWAVIVPLEMGLATPEHAARTLAELRDKYLNRWGLKHTVGNDERVWTLPTATLSRAAYRSGETALGYEMLSHVADTLAAGSIGTFHELIPEGACIIQLWSAATFLRGVIEDMFGIQALAGEHSVQIDPRLPGGWETASLDRIVFGDHCIRVQVNRQVVIVDHLAGSAALTVHLGAQTEIVPVGQQAVCPREYSS